ncbi:delta(1)-pyrroline-2-carboxylate reductase [Quillaja saponaria]|uniref:Delta(1)-pyrroline-2-carboxylate reductase n=1 Tax=Quillaja saponaria TaxID=32244 RepID=A0AAD7PWW9_QUISA|nr:delta(1)-pyrroline-2-carboxylate reductase [Quillaja saponaria]
MPMASSPNPTNNERPSNTNTDPITTTPVFITTESLRSILTHQTLIDHFQSSLPTVSPILQSPIRQNYAVSPSSSLLLMPSWSTSPSLPYIGIKLVTYFPQNSSLNLPGVHANYVLFSSTSGQTLASMDATELTLYRTSCVSGLASKYLAKIDSQVLVMVGAGAMAPHLIKAHLSARPSLRKVIIWNRTEEKARNLAEKMTESDGFQGVSFESNGCLEEIVGLGDIVSCATNSETPLVKGEKLKAGAHLDLVGSFKHSMKECDDEAIRRGRVFVDNEAALVEAGELLGAFQRGVIRKDDVGGILVQLITGEKVGRCNAEEVTVFKSVGSAVVDILAAQLVYETFLGN